MILPEYLSTFFLANAPDRGWPSLFHIITAYNPGYIEENAVNQEKDELLRLEIDALGIQYFRIIGCSPDLKHQEPGWGVTGLSEDLAVQIGIKYGQNAIFEVIDDLVSVIGCFSREKQEIESWRKRLLST